MHIEPSPLLNMHSAKQVIKDKIFLLGWSNWPSSFTPRPTSSHPSSQSQTSIFSTTTASTINKNSISNTPRETVLCSTRPSPPPIHSQGPPVAFICILHRPPHGLAQFRGAQGAYNLIICRISRAVTLATVRMYLGLGLCGQSIA